ncbi:nucleoside-diphosphate-sugar epimerase [Dipodascopsis uninucleata]
MRILVTGAAGFVGQLVVEELLKNKNNTVVMVDIVQPPLPRGCLNAENAVSLKGDLIEIIDSVVDGKLDAAFLFHGIMSSGSEANFELGMKANFDTTRALLEAFRKKNAGLRVVFASGGAVYGRPLPAVVDESVVPTPESSYGAEKLMVEILINDYTRRSFIDGLSLRFPSVTVRPGKPTAAASSFLSGIIREPFDGKECIVPIENRTFVSWVCSPRILLANLMHALTMNTEVFLSHARAVNIPGIGVSVQEMLDALELVGGKEKLQYVKEVQDPAAERILLSWSDKFDNSLALNAGFMRDDSFVQIVQDYKSHLENTR